MTGKNYVLGTSQVEAMRQVLPQIIDCMKSINKQPELIFSPEQCPSPDSREFEWFWRLSARKGISIKFDQGRAYVTLNIFDHDEVTNEGLIKREDWKLIKLGLEAVKGLSTWLTPQLMEQLEVANLPAEAQKTMKRAMSMQIKRGGGAAVKQQRRVPPVPAARPDVTDDEGYDEVDLSSSDEQEEEEEEEALQQSQYY